MVDFATQPPDEAPTQESLLSLLVPGQTFVVRRGEMLSEAVAGFPGVLTKPSSEFDGDVLRVVDRCGCMLAAEIAYSTRPSFGRRPRVSLDLGKIVIQLVPETYLAALTGEAPGEAAA